MPINSFIQDITNLVVTFLTSLLLCILFAIHCLVQDEKCTTLQHVYQACLSTIMVYIRLCQSNLYHNQVWFRTRLRWVHIIRYRTFICINTWNLLWNSTRTTMLCILHPFLHVCQTPIYWTSIISSCIGLLYVELSILIYKQHPPPSKKRIHCQTQTKTPYMFIKNTQPTATTICLYL